MVVTPKQIRDERRIANANLIADLEQNIDKCLREDFVSNDSSIEIYIEKKLDIDVLDCLRSMYSDWDILQKISLVLNETNVSLMFKVKS